MPPSIHNNHKKPLYDMTRQGSTSDTAHEIAEMKSHINALIADVVTLARTVFETNAMLLQLLVLTRQ